MSTCPELARSSGIFLHATSLSSPFGVGDLGPTAHLWVDILSRAGQTWWQLLPIGPTGYGDSPYQSLSTSAGNPILISPDALEADGLVSRSDVAACESSAVAVDFDSVTRAKRRLLAAATKNFREGRAPQLHTPFQEFCRSESAWLPDYSLFVALKEQFGDRPWWEWDKPLAMREASALDAARRRLADSVESHAFIQFLFFRQWSSLRTVASAKGVRILGDLPIYVAEDSVDVWANPSLFQLDADHRPLFVAGVPPDYFTATGQLWGNPVYAWDRHRQTGFQWWIERIRSALRMFDMVRIDHFRGIEAFWSVPAGSPTAAEGQWVLAPGEELLRAIRNSLGSLPLVAEDLGVITPEVDDMRQGFGLPGMRVLQFAFGGAVESRFLPHRFTRDILVTTGTHDNDTTRGWYMTLTPAERAALEAYVPGAERDPIWSLIRTAWSSVAGIAIAPMTDFLDLGSEARMNTPGSAEGNWRWRVTDAELREPSWAERLADLTKTYERNGQL